MNTQSAIMIKLPEAFGAKEASRLGRELKSRMSTDTPHVVVDFSRVREMNLAGMEGLLDCMETVARNDGALQLGEMSPEAAIFLELTRMDRLFNKFPVFDAAAGFTVEQELASETEDLASEKVGQPQTVAA
ncbi:MAG: anti-sigma-factor antagonist [Acidobacteriaceae bacterium]|jgi:anti-anti-sigma regulatory factor|nr:anti-sigma-factor antagonist [Acidobacteriaceae bacterium]